MKRKNLFFLTLVLAIFLFAVESVNAKTSIPVSLISKNILVNSIETNILQKRYSLKITNNSRYDIYHLYVSSAKSGRWGPDQFGDFVLQAGGGTFTLTDLLAATYDLKFVNENDKECVLEEISISQNQNWSLTTSRLSNCEGY